MVRQVQMRTPLANSYLAAPGLTPRASLLANCSCPLRHSSSGLSGKPAEHSFCTLCSASASLPRLSSRRAT